MTYICISENICPLILKTYTYTSYILCICRSIFNAHISVTLHKTICRLQPTTSHHTVQSFHTSHVYRRRTFPTLNKSTVQDVMCMFVSIGLTIMKRSPAWPAQNLKLSTVQVYHVTRFPIRLMHWPLCWHTIPERRVICDNFAHFKFIIFMCIFFLFITLIGDDFLSWVTLQVGYL